MVGECSRAELASPTIEGGAAVTSTSMSIVQRRWLAQTFVDNQIRPTRPGTAVNDAAWIPCLRMDRSELFCTTSRPTVFTQEPFKVRPGFTFVPGVPQSSRPAALGLVVRGRGRADDHPDGVITFLVAKLEQFGDARIHRWRLYKIAHPYYKRTAPMNETEHYWRKCSRLRVEL
jgi:hypothetical protein